MLHIYNTLSGQLEPFKTIEENKVRMYVCGITVYDHCHLGHARVMVFFDMVAKYLRWRGFDVDYVRNITDVDDKIVNRAAENGEKISELTTRFIEAMHEDELALGNKLPTQEPKATEHMQHIIDMILTLMDKGFAYVADDGNVYYRVKKFAAYGELANQDVEKLRVGARVDILETKEDPLDFALWKLVEEGEPSWSSPWGEGRPGWHIECSAMSTHCLGVPFDIHGGGLDLRFPHHQNEVAQSEAATDNKVANTWMHVGHLRINKEKMSKSLGNFFTIREIIAKYKPEVIRYFMLASNYRSPINYSADNLESAEQALQRFYSSLRGITIPDCAQVNTENDFYTRFVAAMDDDFNTPSALAVLFDLVREINRLQNGANTQAAAEHAALLKHLAGVMGLLQQAPEDFLQSDMDADTIKKIETLIADRNQARSKKNWQKADEVRDTLLGMGIVIEDGAGGTTWRRQS